MKIRAWVAIVAMAACWSLPGTLKAAGSLEGTRASAPPAALAGASPFLTVPAETEASVVLLSGVHTKISDVNDPVEGQIVQPVYVDGQLALPPGTLLFGRITNVRPAGRLHRPGQIGFRFDQVSLPDGETESITGRLAALEVPGKLRLDREGSLTGGRQFSWHFLTGALVGASALTIIPKVAGATAGASAASIAAAGFLGYWVLFPRGPEVHLPPDTRCRVRFDYSFTVRGQS